MHTPVLFNESLSLLAPKRGDIVLDCTLGLGGHAKEFTKRIGRRGTLIGIDADKQNLNDAIKALSSGWKIFHPKMIFINDNFINLSKITLPQSPDIIFADLGLSSPHLDDTSRGFSFRENAPLDCRFDRSSGQTVAHLIATTPLDDLAKILKEYGEVEKSYPLARTLKEVSPQTTFELRDAATTIFNWRTKKVLPQIFQALRIAVNHELDALSVLLETGPEMLAEGGRMGIISFHSLEDRMIKNRFKELEKCGFELLTKKPVAPTDDEIERNPRARSAKLRVVRKNN